MTGEPRKALILGANGQDGSYLCETLCARGHNVIAVGRQARPRWPVQSPLYRYVPCDIADIAALEPLLRETNPGIIFHFAAVHGAAGFDYEAVWRQAHMVNTMSVHAILEYIRTGNLDCGLVYASSAKVFGAPLPAHITEDTPRQSTCIYSITKNAAHALIDYYRTRHGIAASVLYLFNHESPRRDAGYFIPRIAEALIRAKTGGGTTSLHTLDFACDWGDAREYMEVAADIGERGLGEDYILSTGRTWTGREMVTQLFARHGLDHAKYLTEKVASAAEPVALYKADNARLKARLGRVPERSILDVFDDMLQQMPAP